MGGVPAASAGQVVGEVQGVAGGAARLDLTLVRENGARPYTRRFEVPLARTR